MGYVSAYSSGIIKRLTCVLKEWSEDSDLSQFFEPENIQGRDFTDKSKYPLTVFSLPLKKRERRPRNPEGRDPVARLAQG